MRRPEGKLFSMRRALAVRTALAVTTSLAVTTTLATLTLSAATAQAADTLAVGGPAPVRAIQPGFLGLSLEYYALLPYTGTDPHAPNPVFLQLIRNLNAGQPPSLRIGGDSTDWTWWPLPIKKPGWVRYSLNKRWLDVAAALAHQLGAHMIMGINLEANRIGVAKAEAHAFFTRFGPAYIDALEPGNEPELYGSWTYYRNRKGHRVYGRPPNYSFRSFEREFARIRGALPGARLAGPTTGSVNWMRPLGDFLTRDPHLGLVTLHRYPLQQCFILPTRPQYPTLAHLLSANSSRGLADSVKPYVDLAHARHVGVRIDEMNSNGCGRVPDVTESFASALWVLDAVSAMANVGVDGVNIHTYPGSSYDLFSFHFSHGHWYGKVTPEYYGLMMFALAAPPGSRPLTVRGSASDSLSTWATLGPDDQTRVLLINDDPRQTRAVAINSGLRVAPAGLIRLQARSLGARDGVTIAGGSFGAATDSGRLSGANHVETVLPVAGSYTVTVPPASATLVVLPRSPG